MLWLSFSVTTHPRHLPVIQVSVFPHLFSFSEQRRERNIYFWNVSLLASVGLGLRGIFCEMFVKMWTKIQKREAESKGERLKKVVELELSQTVLICRYIKKWEGLFRNIDFHTAGMKNDIGHHLECFSIQLRAVTVENASTT